MANETMVRFGYPASLIREYAGWVVLLRQDQITLGSLVLAEKSQATTLSAVAPESLAELAVVSRDIETGLGGAFAPDKLNYLMLMMVDPHVHFHVLPRYADRRDFAGIPFVDGAWPKAPSISDVTPTTAAQREQIAQALREAWPD